MASEDWYMRKSKQSRGWLITVGALIAIGLTLFFGVDYYWKNVCIEIACSYSSMSELLMPLKQSGLIMALILTPFIFLPTNYFKSYFKKVFWWLALLFYVVVATNESGSDLWFDRTDTVYLMGVVSAVVTLAFVLIHYRLGRKE